MKQKDLIYEETIDAVLWHCYLVTDTETELTYFEVHRRGHQYVSGNLNQSRVSVEHPCFHWHNYLMDQQVKSAHSPAFEQLLEDVASGRRLAFFHTGIGESNLSVLLEKLTKHRTIFYHLTERKDRGMRLTDVLICQQGRIRDWVGIPELHEMFEILKAGTQHQGTGIHELNVQQLSTRFGNLSVCDAVRFFMLEDTTDAPFVFRTGDNLVERVSRPTLGNLEWADYLERDIRASLRKLLLGYPTPTAFH